MKDYLKLANSTPVYLIVGFVLMFVVMMCIVFMVKSYKAGLKLGMDKKVLKKAITSSATFTILPSVSILLGVIALSGNLGIPASWFRLSVVGNLSYEGTVADIAAKSMGASLATIPNMNYLVSILMIMTVGISVGCILSVTILKPYSKKIKIGNKKEPELLEDGTKRTGFANWAMIAMFVGMCATFVGSYASMLFVDKAYLPVEFAAKPALPIITALISAAAMAGFQLLIKKKNYSVLENFALAGSMLIGMAGTVIFNIIL